VSPLSPERAWASLVNWTFIRTASRSYQLLVVALPPDVRMVYTPKALTSFSPGRGPRAGSPRGVEKETA
jgi:hypothetical protein